jgi:hypothetical protein
MRHGYAKWQPMPTDQAKTEPESQAGDSDPRTQLSPAARRALAEAAARRAQHKRDAGAAPQEINGRGGRDPTRYGDWEVNGLASDF